MMIFFPSAYPDELLFSLCSRYYARSGNISYKRTLDDIFENRSLTASISLPSGVEALVRNMPNNNNDTVEHYIFKHTLYLYHSTFLSQDQAMKVYQAMCSNDGKAIYVQSGINASGIQQNEFLRYCNECLKEDRATFGEFYWHRSHQLSGVHCCLKHLSPLYNSEVKVVGSNKHRFQIPTLENCCSKNSVLNEVVKKTCSDYMAHFEKMLPNILLLLNHPFEHKPLNWFDRKYRNQLAQQNLAFYTGRVNRKEWREHFQTIYSNKVLQLFQSQLSGEEDWLSMIVQKNRKSFHPIRHLLVMSALNLSVGDVFNEDLAEPFGQPMWPCLNMVCEHFKKPIIEEVAITLCEKSKKPIGTFTCPKCEFSYTRRGPDQEKEDRFKKTRVKAYGSLWQAKLQEYSSLNLCLRELSRTMGADPNTIKRFLDDEEKETEFKEDQNFQEEDRQCWITLQHTYPKKSIKQLRQTEKALYMRLYRKDKEWLQANSPKPLKRTNKVRVDWEKRDEELLQKVKTAVSEIHNAENKPVRVTVSRVGFLIGEKALLEKKLDLLPKTKTYLQEKVETVEQFQERRIRFVIEQMRKDGEEIVTWKVMRKAGIKEYEIWGEFVNLFTAE